MTKLFEMIQNYNMDEVQQLQYRKFIETLDDRVYSRYIKNYIINHIPKIFINAMKNKDSLMIRKIIKLFYYPMPEISQRANGEAHELIRGRKVSNRNASPKKNLKNFFNLEGFFSFIQYLY